MFGTKGMTSAHSAEGSMGMCMHAMCVHGMCVHVCRSTCGPGLQ